jgi:GMP synthase (glutamine-hydrolysing)
MSPARILLLLAGEPSAELKLSAGDYPDWFRQAFGEAASLEPVAAYAGADLPNARGFDGVAMSGSPLSVTDYEREPSMQRAGEYLLETAGCGIPVLGVCFGHQLLARAAGGRVEKNPRGREIGTIEVELTESGRGHPLLKRLGELRFQATHADAVTELPKKATLLAENGFGVQAFSLGANTLCVQFHPELDAPKVTALIDSREAALRAEGIFQRSRDGVRESRAGRELLAAWLASL